MGAWPNPVFSLASLTLPLVIEIVDTEEKINVFLPVLDEIMGSGLATMEKVRVIDYRTEEAPDPNASSDPSC